MATAMLVSTSLTAPGVVKFDFDPDNITMGRSTATANQGNAKQGGATPSIFRRAPGATISLNNLMFYGMDTKPRCDTLLNWMTPGGGLLGMLVSAVAAMAGMNLSTRLPVVTFSWGPPMMGFMYDCVVNRATVKYTRFDSSGIPIRATVGIEMQEQPSMLSLLSTNPTSGGVPGRRAHQFTDGESLQSIATSNYGSPGYWRGIAETNGIDDPLRVRPGDPLYLPNPTELPRRVP
jgi:nucleoid-associated protein YgaU